jgi:anti-sigma factor RsiW
MNETVICGDHEALMSYLYDECAPHERRVISAHVAICNACAEELMALGATREQLALWAPPDVQLGFRIVSDARRSASAQATGRDGATILRPPSWWRQPMPAWGQAAAAVLIFATGVTLGVMRAAAPAAERPALLQTNATNSSVSKAELVALEQRLRSEISQSHAVSTSVAATTPADTHILQQVRTMIDESEQRQRRELVLRAAEMVRDFDAQRNDDLARIERTLGQMDGTTGVEVAQQRQMLNYLMRVSQRGQ